MWTIPTEPTPFAHFATWPQALVRRMIQAGTSEKGCCPECGAPWVRETEREAVNVQATNTSSQSPHGMDNNRTHPRASLSVATVGWSPSCDHRVSGQHYGGVPYPAPCTVLDPFAGSATTCLVARNQGRHAIGIELNETYLKIAGQRLAQLSLLALEPEPARLLDA